MTAEQAERKVKGNSDGKREGQKEGPAGGRETGQAEQVERAQAEWGVGRISTLTEPLSATSTLPRFSELLQTLQSDEIGRI